MRKTLIALMFAAALPTVAMAMPEGNGPMGPMDGPRHSEHMRGCLLYTSPSPRDRTRSRMPSSA